MAKYEPRFFDDLTFEECIARNKLHLCEFETNYFTFGQAITACFEDLDGRLYVTNWEYGSQVNFCPWCGFETNVKVIEI